MNINAIIQCLDNYMLQKGMKQIGAVEANAVLEAAGLLRNNNMHRGKPLRDLLRAGRLPYAYQRGRTWIIPVSSRSADKIIKSEKPEPIIHKTSQTFPAATRSLPPVIGDILPY